MKLLTSLLVGSTFAQTIPPTTVPPSDPSEFLDPSVYLDAIEQCCIDVVSNIPINEEGFVEKWTKKEGI